MRFLVSWIGQTDLNAAAGHPEAGLGPIGQALTQRVFDQGLLLCNYSKTAGAGYLSWAKQLAGVRATLDLVPITLSRPTHLGEIYTAVTDTVGALRERHGDATRLTFHLSPGTPAMAAVWIIVAKTRYGAELIESSKQGGVRTAEIPFNLSAEFVPEVYRSADRALNRLGAGIAETTPGFGNIVCAGPALRAAVERATRIARRSVPVLIEGESGTGKELFARNRSDPRS